MAMWQPHKNSVIFVCCMAYCLGIPDHIPSCECLCVEPYVLSELFLYMYDPSQKSANKIISETLIYWFVYIG